MKTRREREGEQRGEGGTRDVPSVTCLSGTATFGCKMEEIKKEGRFRFISCVSVKSKGEKMYDIVCHRAAELMGTSNPPKRVINKIFLRSQQGYLPHARNVRDDSW